MPSSQAVWSFRAVILHLPEAGSQRFCAQEVLPMVGQFTTVASLTSHTLLTGLQYSVPLQALESSLLAQSPSAKQPQMLCVAWHLPARHFSAVHGLPSSHQRSSPIRATSAHLPVAGPQEFTAQSVSLTDEQVMTVAGLTSQFPLALLQKSVPLQRLLSSLTTQSLS